MYFEPVITKTGLNLPECSLHSITSRETKEVKTFSTKTSRDVEMEPSVSEEHMCPHGKMNWWKNFRNKEGHVATIPCATTQVDIIIAVHTRKVNTQHQRSYTV